jgi:dihydrofolate reductase
MGKIVAFTSVTLDGVMQAPGRPDEDPREGFEHGGWAIPYADPVMWEDMGTGGSLLLGRRTYEDLYGYWPHQTDNPFTEVLNNTRKYVASTTLNEPLPWSNSVLLKGDVVEAVAEIRAESGKDVVVLGSGELLQSLMRASLVDEYVLLIHPLVLGSGQKLFRDGTPVMPMKLVDTKSTTTGVVIATFAPDGNTQTRDA